MSKVQSISIVIATLGGEFLKSTVEHLNQSTIRPDEILICMPADEAGKLDFVLPGNACLIRTPMRGQVAQRACGLARASGALVMQLDDDVILPPDGIELLIASLENAGPCSAVAPLFKDCRSGNYATSYRHDLRGVLQSLSATVIGGAPWGARRMGRIDKSGMPYAVDRVYCEGEDLVEVEWLPGGCVLTQRTDIIVDDYFPFRGKAYSEDVMHSLHWRRKGVRLWISPDVAVCTYVSIAALTATAIRADFEARKHVVSLMGGSLVRCWLWFFWIRVRERFVSASSFL